MPTPGLHNEIPAYDIFAGILNLSKDGNPEQ